MIWEFDVAVSTHERLRRGELAADWRRVEVLAPTYREASLVAYAMACGPVDAVREPDEVVVTDLLWRL